MKRLEHVSSEAREREAQITELKRAVKSGADDLKGELSQLQKEDKKQRKKRRKHEKVLFVAFYILLNLVSTLSKRYIKYPY